MPNYRTKAKDIIIRDMPQEFYDNEASRKQMVASLRAASGEGTYNFQDVAQAQAKPESTGSSLAGTPEQQAQITPPDPAKPKTTASGIADAFATNIAPTAVAALLPFGALSERITSMVTPWIAEKLNETFNLEGTNWEQMSSQEMYDKIQHDWLGREKADTPVENVAGTMGRAGAESLAALDAAKAIGTLGTGLKTGVNALNPLKVKIAGAAEQTSQVLAEAPAKEMISGMGAGFGAGTVNELVKDTNLPAPVKALLEFGGAMFTGVAASKLDDLGKLVNKFMKANRSTMPEAAAEVIKLADDYGIDVLTSDFDPSTRRGKDRRIARETAGGGTRDIRGGTPDVPGQASQRVEAVENLKERYNVPEGTNLDQQLDTISQDFWTKRDGEFNSATTARDEVFETIAGTNSKMPVEKTAALIDDKIADLVDGKDADMQPFINKLTNWKEMITDQNLSKIEEHRDTIGRLFSDKANDGFNNKKNQETIDEIYRSLRQEMGEHIEAVGSPGDFRKFEDAMGELSRLSDDFNTKVGIPTIMNGREGAPIKAMSTQLFNNSPEEVLKIYQRLTPVGQQNARAALITKMLDESTDLVTMSPNQFTKKLKEYGGQRGVLFGAEDTDYLGGLKKVLDQTSSAEADQMVKNLLPLDGTPGVSRGMAGFILKHPITGISTLLASKAFKGEAIRYIESPNMRDLLLKFDALPPAQQAATQGQEILKRMGDAMRAHLVADDSDENTPMSPNNTQGEK